MQYKNVVNNCLSRFLSEYKITEFNDKISSNVGAKVHDVEGCNHIPPLEWRLDIPTNIRARWRRIRTCSQKLMRSWKRARSRKRARSWFELDSVLTIWKRTSGLATDGDWRLTCQFWRHKSLVLEGTKALSLWHQNVVELSSASWINSITNLLNEHYFNYRLIREENLQKPQSGKKL
jgi:hypothetical protein